MARPDIIFDKHSLAMQIRVWEERSRVLLDGAEAVRYSSPQLAEKLAFGAGSIKLCIDEAARVLENG